MLRRAASGRGAHQARGFRGAAANCFGTAAQQMRLKFSNGGGMKTPGLKKGFWSRFSQNTSRACWPLSHDALCAEARRRTRLADFGDPAIESRLSLLVRSLECHADLHPLGRLLARIH